MASADGWHPEDIKAAIRKTGITLTELSLRNGLSESAVRMAILFQTCPSGEQAIADYLDIHPHTIWPRRYDANGNRIIGNARRKSNQGKQSGHGQKRRAA